MDHQPVFDPVSWHITANMPSRELNPTAREQYRCIFQVGFNRGFEALLINVYSDRCNEQDAEEAAIEFLEQWHPEALSKEERDGSVGASFVKKLMENNSRSKSRQLIENENNVYWREIPSGAKVIDRGASWTLEDGSLIYWHGNEAVAAYKYLSKIAKSDGVKFNRNPSISKSSLNPDYYKKYSKSEGIVRPFGESTEEADAIVPSPEAPPESTVTKRFSGIPSEIRKAISQAAKQRKISEMSGELPPTRDDLDEFTKAYIDAILFSEMDNSDESGGEPLDKNYTIEDFAPSALKAIIADCKKFQEENAEAIRVGADRGSASPEEQAGHDLHFTRSGSGVGFWDGDWPEPQGAQLTKAAKAMGQVDFYVGDDGLIYQWGRSKANQASIL